MSGTGRLWYLSSTTKTYSIHLPTLSPLTGGLSVHLSTIAPDKSIAGTRLRLHLDIPTEQKCPNCHWQQWDTTGNHGVMCGSGPLRIWLHNSIRDFLAKAIENTGFKLAVY